ncbi:MAG: sulfatase/phosphatase domain-containing protein, partial [Limisphaerales bacterium]
TRVCAAVRWPKGGLSGGKQFGERIGYIDVLPTLLAAAGIEIPKNVDGVNILPALQGKGRLPDRPWFSYIHQNKDAHASVHLGEWKLVAHGDFFAKDPITPPRYELYHLKEDISEKHDLSPKNPGKVKELSKLLQEFGSWQKPGVGAYEEGRDGFKAPKNWVIQ